MIVQTNRAKYLARQVLYGAATYRFTAGVDTSWSPRTKHLKGSAIQHYRLKGKP